MVVQILSQHVVFHRSSLFPIHFRLLQEIFGLHSSKPEVVLWVSMHSTFGSLVFSLGIRRRRRRFRQPVWRNQTDCVRNMETV